MIETVLGIYGRSPAAPPRDADAENVAAELQRRKWIVFLTITFGYGFYYVCRLSFSVVRKPMVDAGLFNAVEIGTIGSALFFSYAFGKLANGVLADRVNVRLFMATGLLVSALVNLLLGFATAFWLFLVLWGINGWFQSFGAPSSVVSIAHWCGSRERGSFYGMWSTSHNLGEAITFVGIAFVVASLGWTWGFRAAGMLCLAMSLVIWRLLYERPEVYGLPAIAQSVRAGQVKHTVSEMQLAVFRNPAVWVLALASAFFYVTRYAVNSWGIFFLEAEKGYSTVAASSIISANALAGILGTFFSGILSDRLFRGRRNVPALLFGMLYTLAIALFVMGPANAFFDTASMVLFGLALGALLVYLGGLMAVDICSKEVAGTALGIVGVASYVGAGIQEFASGWLIERRVTMVNGEMLYDFDEARLLWIGAAVVSLILTTLVWNAKSPDDSQLM